jgi:hypothetical protein
VEAHKGRVELSITPKAGTSELAVHSWQALRKPDGRPSGNPIAVGREASIIRADGSQTPIDWFPSFEIRVVRGDNAYPFKTLIERFHPSPPTGYVLVGF